LYILNVEFSHAEKSADTRETKVAKSSCGIFHVPTVNDLDGKELEKDTLSERKPARSKHDMDKTQAARSVKSSRQNGMVSIGEYHPSAQVTSEMNSGSTESSNIFKGKIFGSSNSFSHDMVCWIANISLFPVLALILSLYHLFFFNKKILR
jgi:topoisomerase (DNA) II binding protein 1